MGSARQMAKPRWEAASEWSGGDACDIDGQTERSKWAGAHESTGKRVSFNREMEIHKIVMIRNNLRVLEQKGQER
jgi:hypothetical protein